MNIFVGSSSSKEIDENLKTMGNELIEEIAKIDDITLVFGASFTGSMQEVAKIFDKHKQKKIGVTVNIYKKTIDTSNYTKVYFEKSPLARTKKIHELADIALFLPGGFGTLEELFSFLMEKDEMKDDKLIILYNKDFFFTPLIEYLYKLEQDQLIRNKLSNYVFISNDIDEIINKIKEKERLK